MSKLRTIADLDDTELAIRLHYSYREGRLDDYRIKDLICEKRLNVDRILLGLDQHSILFETSPREIYKSPGPATRVKRYVDVSCPAQVGLSIPRISLVVRLNQRDQNYDSALRELLLDPNSPVTVLLHAPGFEVLGAGQATTQVLPAADSPPVVFDLRPQTLGTLLVTLQFFQGNQPAGTVVVPVEIIAGTHVEGSSEARIAGALEFAQREAEPPDQVLIIQHEPHGAFGQLRFLLLPRGGVGGERFTPVVLESDLAAAGAVLYEQLAHLRAGVDPGAASTGATVELRPAALIRQLRALGNRLWETLVPHELKLLYAQDPQHWRDHSLLLMTDEAVVPWELLWPYSTGQWGPSYSEELPFCLHLRMTRWLQHDSEKSQGHPAPRQHLNIGRLAVFAPTDTGLKEVRAERDLLCGLAAAEHIQDLSPSVPTEDRVLAVLDQNIDWIHFATHGKFDASAPDAASILVLEGEMTLSPTLIDASIQSHMQSSRPGVFLNACELGRQGTGLTQLAGWANRMLSAGAGLFLAPMWAATSEHALLFAQAFYRACLSEQHRVGDASRAARLALWQKQDGDPTWLAYAVYAHPNAQLHWQPTTKE